MTDGSIEITTILFTFSVPEREQHGPVCKLSLILTHHPMVLAAWSSLWPQCCVRGRQRSGNFWLSVCMSLSHLPEVQAPRVGDSILLFLVLRDARQGQSDCHLLSIIYGRVLLQ